MTARTGDVIEQAARVVTAMGGPWKNRTPLSIANALADAGLLRREPPTRDEIKDELSGWPIGGGYYGTSVGIDEAGEMADAVLALLEGENR